jgi:hypothetical protein
VVKWTVQHKRSNNRPRRQHVLQSAGVCVQHNNFVYIVLSPACVRVYMCVCAARFLAHFLRYTRKIRYWRGRRGCPSVRPSVCQHNSPVLKISIPDFCIKFCTHGRETLLKEIGIPFLIGSPIISLTNCLTIAHRNRVGSWKTGRADKSILRHYNRERIWRHPDGNYSH